MSARENFDGVSMQYISVFKDGVEYEAEYFNIDGEITVVGEGDTEMVVMNGMNELHAAKTALRKLIRNGKISPKENE